MNCDICGKELKEQDKAYATSTGSIEVFAIGNREEDVFLGFEQDELEGWLTAACESCGKKISEFIVTLQNFSGGAKE